MSSCRADLTEAFAGLIAVAVQDAARRIEAEAFRLAFPDARVLGGANGRTRPARWSRSAATTWSSATRAARGALGLTAEAWPGRFPPPTFNGVQEGRHFSAAERGVVQRALARAHATAAVAAREIGFQGDPLPQAGDVRATSGPGARMRRDCLRSETVPPGWDRSPPG